MRILIAEDSPVEAILLRNIVSRGGHDALVVGDAESALEELEEHPEISLALVDIRLPGMSGIDLVRRLRDDERFQALPVIFASGVSDAATVHEAAALHPESYILKPFTEPSLILSRIQRVAERVPQVVGDVQTIRANTGLDLAGIRALGQELTLRLEGAVDGGGASPDEVQELTALARELGARRFVDAGEEAEGRWTAGSRLHREAQALLNCLPQLVD